MQVQRARTIGIAGEAGRSARWWRHPLWVAYGLICAVILLLVLALGLRDRDALGTMLVAGGSLDQAPAIVYFATALCAVLAAWRTRATLRGWGALALLGVFLMGEETSWGAESLFGWTLRTVEKSDKWDLHNYISGWITERTLDGQGLVLLIVLIAAGWLAVRYSHRVLRALSLPHRSLLLLGMALIVVGSNIDTMQDTLGTPYITGQWPLEETSELLGSIALLLVPVAALLWQRRGAGPIGGDPS